MTLEMALQKHNANEILFVIYPSIAFQFEISFVVLYSFDPLTIMHFLFIIHDHDFQCASFSLEI